MTPTHDRIEIYRDKSADALWRYRRKARNGEIGPWSQGYTRRYDCLVAVARWNRDVYRENVVDLTRGGLRVQSSALSGLASREEG